MGYGVGAWGQFTYGEGPVAPVAPSADASRDLQPYGVYAWGQNEEVGGGVIHVNAALVSGGATLDASISVSVKLNGSLESVAASGGGLINLPPALSVFGDLTSGLADLAAVVTTSQRVSGDLVSQNAIVDGAINLSLAFSGALVSGPADVTGAIGALLSVNGSLESGPATISADVLLFRKRRWTSAHAY